MIEMLLSTGGVMFKYSTITRIQSGSGTTNPPAGAKAMRVAAIGAGGGAASRSSNNNHRAMGGSGGGCAATMIVKAAPITYSIGTGGERIMYNSTSGTDPAGDGGDTVATFLDYELIGKGGLGGYVNQNSAYSREGGIGIGGDYSFQGGAAYRVWSSNTVAQISSGGGGGAGPNGNGADGIVSNSGYENTASQGSFTNSGWGAGGGASGILISNISGRRGGGAGMGQFSGDSAALSTSIFGRSDGAMGGGGSTTNVYYAVAPQTQAYRNGGPGGLVIEWFF